MRWLVAASLLTVSLAGCAQFDDLVDRAKELSDLDFQVPDDLSLPIPAEQVTWPDLSDRTLRILDHGAFWSFDSAAARFTNLTGAQVVHVEAEDTGSALNRAVLDKGDPQFDLLYGIDNVFFAKAVQEEIFHPYTPYLASRIDPQYRFMDPLEPWPATPTDVSFTALNIYEEDPALDNITLEDLLDVRDHAERFVSSDPNLSPSGLTFLLATISVFGEETPYDWTEYWDELFANGIRITTGWTEAYETYYSGGYGVWEEGHVGGYPIVTSYTNSPAYEAYYGADPVAKPLLDHRGKPTAFRSIQTTGILAGTDQLALAQAWIEFTLTDDFQRLSALENVVYPVVDTVHASTQEVYGDVDPEPGSFEVVDMDWMTIGDHLEDWLLEWTDLCEAHDCR